MTLRKAFTLTAVTVAGLAGYAGEAGNVAHAATMSQAKPKPDASCTRLYSRATYYTPVRHTRDRLECLYHVTRSGNRVKVWRIIH